jgi:hypothetical protein
MASAITRYARRTHAHDVCRRAGKAVSASSARRLTRRATPRRRRSPSALSTCASRPPRRQASDIATGEKHDEMAQGWRASADLRGGVRGGRVNPISTPRWQAQNQSGNRSLRATGPCSPRVLFFFFFSFFNIFFISYVHNSSY